jgi:hypothetical protein
LNRAQLRAHFRPVLFIELVEPFPNRLIAAGGLAPKDEGERVYGQ